MKAKDKLELLEQIKKMSTITPQDAIVLFAAYKAIINPNRDFCGSCPGDIKKAYSDLMNYYNLQKENLNKQANEDI